MWEPAAQLKITRGQRRELEALVNAPKSPQKMVLRGRIAVLAADGESNNQIARILGTSRPTVIHWRRQFEQDGIDGLIDATRPGRNKSLSDRKIQTIVEATQFKKPKHATHWSTRAMAEEFGVSHMVVQRIWRDYNLKPHRTGTFKMSQDPLFVQKVRDVVGLYLNPPDKALVLCVDEKTQIQALDRTQPLLPLRPGQIERQTHDYTRHGTTNLFAALDVASGKVITECYRRHRHQEMLRFLKRIDEEVDTQLDVHLVLDNYCTHKHAKVRAWLAKHPRFHIHFTPTSASWLNQVEIWFSVLTRKRIRRGTFTSTMSLTATLREYSRATNRNPQPFVWTKSAKQILNHSSIVKKR